VEVEQALSPGARECVGDRVNLPIAAVALRWRSPPSVVTPQRRLCHFTAGVKPHPQVTNTAGKPAEGSTRPGQRRSSSRTRGRCRT